MSASQEDSINAIINRAYTLMDSATHEDIHKKFEFQRDVVLSDETLTEDVKNGAVKKLTKYYDRNKVLFNEGERRICEVCDQERLATLFCEYCLRNYLKARFSTWTSRNDEIDNLIRECQVEALGPDYIVEWIPYCNLQNVEYLTKGGISKIFKADWIDGHYDEWDFETKQIRRTGTFEVILKGLENVESANHSWFEEAKSHLTINSKRPEIVRCYGLTQDTSNGNYMLVMMKMNTDLKDYLQQNHNQLTWKKRIRIALEIIDALYYIHKENAVHRDLHSGNILYSQFEDYWFVSDLGFCGPADKPLKSVYGNLPYLAPEVMITKEYTFASDIYSIGMLMWEIAFGHPPLVDYKHGYDLVMNIINGLRPKFASEIPLEYKSLIEQCWDANPSKRPDIYALRHEIIEISKLYRNMPDDLFQSKLDNLKPNQHRNYAGSRLFAHQFDSLVVPKNATEASYTKLHEFVIPDDYDDFDETSNQDIDEERSLDNHDSKDKISD